MIRMTTWPQRQSRHDNAITSWNGHEFSARAFSATATLARQLVAAGCPDQPWEAYTPDGQRSLHGPSLHAWAKRAVVEYDRGGLRIGDYQEHPISVTRRERQTARNEPDGDDSGETPDAA